MNIYKISQKINTIINTNKISNIHPKTGKLISPFGHEINSTQGAIDMAFINASPDTTLQDVLFQGIEKEVSVNRTEYCQESHKNQGHTLSGHYARKAIDKGQGKVTYLGSKRESGQKTFRTNFVLCGGNREAWQAIHDTFATINSEAKALGKYLKSLCPPEVHLLDSIEVRLSIADLKRLAYKNAEIESAWKSVAMPETLPSVDEIFEKLESEPVSAKTVIVRRKVKA